ncbi:hypothetical protein LOTGIDRAFT_173330 [Lottia gigantea]|uniref:C-type lectin domain-containing protein n=1 Tax=Lottia gigantea TaxID=225164 RepID=V4CE61_LOTGI|nr:hypothetical protein LOTGIDRAFT_173330 [Lottia gigantea]ESP00245.1 hypothetical protein LOTGIDRAFT_173330 [Lottia gigantea]
MLLVLVICQFFMVGVRGQIDTWIRGQNSLTLNGKYKIKTDATSVVACSFECSSQFGCRHFFFDFTTNRCYLNSKFFDSQSLTTLNASRYDISGGDICPATFKLTEDGICFLVMNNPGYKVNFDHARRDCQVYGADLMVIDSQRKHDVLLNYVDEDKHYLFGIYNITINGEFLTVDGRTDADFTYRNWNVNYPNGTQDATYGVFRTIGGGPLFQWKNAINLQRYYICEL